MRGYRGRRVRNALDGKLPRLTDNERIYLNVSYADRQFARACRCGFDRACRCGFDRERKLWFTGACNDELGALVELYGVDDEHTSDDAKRLMRMALDTSDRDELMAKVLDWYEKRGIRGE